MFDWIRFEMDCPTCKGRLKTFQSKSAGCSMFHLEFWEVDNFYDSCSNCDTWVEFVLGKRPNREITIKDYERIIKVPPREDANWGTDE